MRYALLIGRRHGSPVFAALGDSLSPGEANIAFKALLGEPGDLAELHLLISDQGVTKRKKFDAPATPLQSATAPHETPAPDPAPAEPVVASGAEEAGPDLPDAGESLAEADEPSASKKGKVR